MKRVLSPLKFVASCNDSIDQDKIRCDLEIIPEFRISLFDLEGFRATAARALCSIHNNSNLYSILQNP